MEPPRKVRVRYGPQGTTVVLSPGAETTLLALERPLQRWGVSKVTVRQMREVHLSLNDLAAAREALAGWELELEPSLAAEFERWSSHEDLLSVARQAVQQATDPEVVSTLLREFPGANRLDPHQQQALAVATHPAVVGLCLFDEQGLGKTVTTLFTFHRLRELGEVGTMVVLAPKNMVLEWVRDGEQFLGSTYRVVTVVGDEHEKRRALDERADIYVTNFETVVRLNTKLREVLAADRGRSFLVVDESFFVKNAAALRTQAVRRLRRSVRRCLVLCGTPAPNSPHDLVEQFNIADGGVAFRGVRIPKDRSEARPIVQHVVRERGIYLRRLKQQALPDLPEKGFQRVLVPLQPVQERAYRAALTDLIDALRATDDVTFKKQLASFLARRAALLQLCSSPASVLDGYRETPAKLLALDAVLEELIARRGEKVVVWSYFTASLETILHRYAHFRPVRCDGAVTLVEDRREAVRRFQEDDETMLFVANPAAAGAGITLHRARYAVYESMSNQAAHYLQSLDRIHRRGQTRPVEYVVLLCDRTIELQEYDRLMAKEEAARELLGDQDERPVTRTTMLDEVLAAGRMLDVEQGRAA